MNYPDKHAPIVILTGAGISKESGLSTFRDKDGIWATVRIEDVATPEAFAADPGRVHDFYNHRRRGLLSSEIEPNTAHKALANLEEKWPGGVLIITQNIDDLHERGGAENVLHMHGELLKARCGSCGHVADWRGDLSVDTPCPACTERQNMRPHVVWFGEMPFHMEAILEKLGQCGLFMSIGTSGAVYPAAGFAAMVRDKGQARTVEINLEPSEGATWFEEAHYGPATQKVPEYVAALLLSAGIEP